VSKLQATVGADYIAYLSSFSWENITVETVQRRRDVKVDASVFFSMP